MMVSPPEALFGSFQLLEMEAALWGARGLSWGWGWLIVRLHKSQGWDPLTWHDTSQKDVQVLRAQTLTAADVSHGRPGVQTLEPRLWRPPAVLYQSFVPHHGFTCPSLTVCLFRFPACRFALPPSSWSSHTLCPNLIYLTPPWSFALPACPAAIPLPWAPNAFFL